MVVFNFFMLDKMQPSCGYSNNPAVQATGKAFDATNPICC